MDDAKLFIPERRSRSRTLNGESADCESQTCTRQTIYSESSSGESDAEGESSACQTRRHPILKRSRSVPVSPNRKNVHFADCFGIPLVSVRKYFEQRESDSCMSRSSHASSKTQKAAALNIKWKLGFKQPASEADFMDRVMWSNVCLENLVATQLTFLGTVKVKNLSYHKEVIVRYTLDGWKTYRDVIASYVSNSCDITTDRFSFGIRAPENLKENSCLEFAIRYRVSDNEFWDNNYGQNYSVVCSEIE